MSPDEKPKGFFRDRFNYLLILIILLLVTAPFLRIKGEENIFLLFYALVFLVSNILILKIMIRHARSFLAASVFFTAVFMFEVAVKRSGAAGAEWITILADGVYAVFLVLFLHYLFRALVTEKKVTSDSIKGGICIYFLFGILWGIIYRILDFFDPSAFLFQAPAVRNLFYFSYVTLTTVGYGDIVPASPPAQTLAFMEAVTGQIFLAVFIARLMGLHIAHVINRKDEQG
jgi:voltage-gated potassium channel Kch